MCLYFRYTYPIMRENINIRAYRIFVVYNVVQNLLKFSELPKVVTWTTKLNLLL